MASVAAKNNRQMAIVVRIKTKKEFNTEGTEVTEREENGSRSV
jgi:hypothetical protein